VRGSDIIVEMLIAYDVDYVFGVAGDTSVRLYESLYDSRDRITHILARDERSASFMADAYARLTFKPGVCESPSGAGALYTVPGVAEANASSVPVIALTSGVDLASEGKGTITELDHHVLYQSITKWSHFIKRYDKIPDTMRRAFRIATTGRPGAVHVAFPPGPSRRWWSGRPTSSWPPAARSSSPAAASSTRGPGASSPSWPS
jgi:acetolactate synthase-1/2/3 large subunit